MNYRVPKLHKWGFSTSIGNVLFRTEGHTIHVRHQGENILSSKAVKYKDIDGLTRQSF